jgi:ribosomal protein S18 acetylase RimI-like enzyme
MVTQHPLTLRPATQADGEALFQLLKATMQDYVARTWGWDEAWQRAYFWDRFDPATERIVVLDGKDIGVLAVSEQHDRLFVERLYILPSYQGRGIGTQLLRGIMARAFDRELPVRLRVLKVNPARRLYERLGFAQVGETETSFIMEAARAWDVPENAKHDSEES